MGNLNRMLFTEENMKRLEAKRNVLHVSDMNITYKAERKPVRCTYLCTQTILPLHFFQTD